MRRRYHGSTKVKRAQLQALCREVKVFCMKDNETINEYFSRTFPIANKMTCEGEKIEQTIIVEKVLRYMTIEFNYVVCSIEESNDVTTLSIDELQSSLLVHEHGMKITQEKEDVQVLNFASYDRGGINNRGKGHGGFHGHGRGRLSIDQIQCYKCHKIRHYQSECSSWQENSVNFVEFDESEEFLLMAQKEDTKSNNQLWFRDSECSKHMVGTKE